MISITGNTSRRAELGVAREAFLREVAFEQRRRWMSTWFRDLGPCAVSWGDIRVNPEEA